MANRTTLVDNNSHIALAGKAMSSNESAAFSIMTELNVDYVLVIFGGVIGYSGDDINKFLWLVRIAEDYQRTLQSIQHPRQAVEAFGVTVALYQRESLKEYKPTLDTRLLYAGRGHPGGSERTGGRPEEVGAQRALPVRLSRRPRQVLPEGVAEGVQPEVPMSSLLSSLLQSVCIISPYSSKHNLLNTNISHSSPLSFRC